jgi:hypothetical protein
VNIQTISIIGGFFYLCYNIPDSEQEAERGIFSAVVFFIDSIPGGFFVERGHRRAGQNH